MNETEFNTIEVYSAYDRISKLLEYLFIKFNIPKGFLPIVTKNLWENKPLCLEIDKEVFKLWEKKKRL